MTDWKSKFDSISKIDRSSRFDTYKAKKNGQEYFIKNTNEDTDSWSRTSINKEYEVYEAVNLDKFRIPEVRIYNESELLGVEWIDSNDWKNLHEDHHIKSLIKSFKSLIDSLSKHDDLELNNRWPNTKEFQHRLDATVSFNQTGFSELKPVITEAKNKLMSTKVPQSDKSLVHGDLFYPNILFNSQGNVKSIIDWEIAGYFDQMYDVGFIESNIMDILSLYSNSFTRDEILRMFRNELNLTREQIKRVKLYKLWPYYVKLAAIDADSYNPYYYPENIDPETQVLKLFNESVEETKQL